MSFLFFTFLTIGPRCVMQAAAAAMRTMEKKGRAAYALLPFFQDNRPIKLLSRQCFERLGINVQKTFADCSQTRLYRVLILVAN